MQQRQHWPGWLIIGLLVLIGLFLVRPDLFVIPGQAALQPTVTVQNRGALQSQVATLVPTIGPTAVPTITPQAAELPDTAAFDHRLFIVLMLLIAAGLLALLRRFLSFRKEGQN